MRRDISTKLVLVAIAFAFAVPTVSATYSNTGCPVLTKETGTVNGNIYYEVNDVWPGTYKGSGSRQVNTSFNVPAGAKVGRFYTGVWGGSPSKTGNITVVFNENAFPTREIKGDSGSPCGPDDTPEVYGTGCGVWANAFNVTPYLVSWLNTVSITTNAPCANCSGSSPWDGSIYTAALVVVYEDESLPEMTYWLNEGAGLLLTGESVCGPGYNLTNFTVHCNGTIPDKVDVTRLWTLGFKSNCPPPELNSNYIGNPDYAEIVYAYGFLRWDNLTNYIDLTNPSNNNLYYNNTDPEYERVVSAVLTISAPVCGNVNGDEGVDMGDVILLANHVGYPGSYTVDNEWAANVNGDLGVDMGDVILLANYVGYPGEYELNCE